MLAETRLLEQNHWSVRSRHEKLVGDEAGGRRTSGEFFDLQPSQFALGQDRHMRKMGRRGFLRGSAAMLLAARSIERLAASETENAPKFSTDDLPRQTAYDRALAVLNANVQVLPRFDGPVLIEGANYAGIWQECGPHEALVYRQFRPDVARNSHLTFFALQRDDGQIPANNKANEAGFGQIQMVVPIAATAWQLARATGDDELLDTAYRSCARWDQWLMRHRNTRQTGLIEGFCTYDTGHDNSPRWSGMPNQCPEKDARVCPQVAGLPRLCPDLSATMYGALVALAQMAKVLGKNADADRWSEEAERIRGFILAKLFVEEDAAFYDLDANGQFIRIRSDILSRVCGEHVVDPKLFESLWERQIHNPRAFWAIYPLPSIALDDPTFVRPIPRNSWGGASQALTALRAPRWFEFYRKPAALSHLMDRWCDAILRDSTFRQQLDPLTGIFTQGDAPNYSPAALVMVDFTWRLAGVREEADTLEWNARPGHAVSRGSEFAIVFDKNHRASMRYDNTGATFSLNGRPIGRVDSGIARLITDKSGHPQSLVGISEHVETISLSLGPHPPRRMVLQPDESLALAES
jgi:hypothetical protein